MAIRCDAAADRLLATANMIDVNGSFTVMFWFYISSAPATDSFNTLYIANNNDIFTGDSELDGIDVTNSGGNNRIEVYCSENGTFNSTRGTTNLSNSTWYHVAIRRNSATNIQQLLNGVWEGTQTANMLGSRTITRSEFGVAGSSNTDPFNGRFAAIKEYDAYLSDDEILNEMRHIRPVRFANLRRWLPVFPGSGERGNDYSGNNYDYTEGGTLTDEDPPPVSW